MQSVKLSLTKVIFSVLTYIIIFASQAAEVNRPNIILITADDMGFDDMSGHKNLQLNTPNLDTLANQSLRFTDFSVTPVCATTRAALLTGRDAYKTGVSGVHGGRDYMQLDETLISNVLQNNGYNTGTWGKWHVGKTRGYLPEDRGFDQAYYAELYRHENTSGFLNGKPVAHNKWVSEVVTDYAIDFIADNQKQVKKQPFFAYLSFLAPHEPWLAPDKFVEPLIQQGLRPAIANLYGMVEEMDFHIGRLLKYLEKSNLAKDTIVIFLSDNGPWFDSSNFGAMTQKEWQLRNPSKMNGNKGQSWQNGIRSPLFIKWQGHWQAKTINRYSDVKDIFPTIVELLDIKLQADHKELDGYSLLPMINNTMKKNPRETYVASHDVISKKALFNQWTPVDASARDEMHFTDQILALRNEHYKLILNPAMDRSHYPRPEARFSLFDMQTDPLERNNIIADQPDIAKAMQQRLTEKFLTLKASQQAYQPPVFLVDAQQPVSVINGFGPSNTGGNTKSKAHVLTHLKTVGDFADYNIDVANTAEFDVYIKQTSHNSVGMLVQLSTENEKINHELHEANIQKMGTMTLHKGLNTLKFEVMGSNSYKSWSQISGLRRFLLVPKGSSIDLNNYQLPQ